MQITFYPESGHFVNGLLSRVAFKATTREGKDLQISGFIVDSNQDTLLPFHTTHRGMGSFLFAPEKGKTYTAHCHFGHKDYIFPLPAAEDKGYNLTVYNHPDGPILVRIRQTVNNRDTLGLTVICRGKVCIFQEGILTGENPWNLRINPGTLPAGVNNFILFDKTGKMLCERKIFVQAQKKDLVQIKILKPDKKYLPQEKINLEFNIREKDSLPLACTFSLAVRDSASETTTFDNDNILSNLLLSSEIRGFIPRVAYYFEKQDGKHQQDLDLLMMVQGWSRYSWEHMCGLLPFIPPYQPEKDINFEGIIKIISSAPQRKRATDTKGYYKPLSRAPLTLELMKDTLIIECKGQTDTKGAFSFPLGSLEGEWQYFLKVNPQVQKQPEESPMWDPRIILNPKFTPGIKPYSYYEQNKQEVNIDFLIQRNDTIYQNIILEEAVVQEQERHAPSPSIKLKVRNIYDELHIYGITDNNATLLDICFFALVKTHQLPGYGIMVYHTSKGIEPGSLIAGLYP